MFRANLNGRKVIVNEVPLLVFETIGAVKVRFGEEIMACFFSNTYRPDWGLLEEEVRSVLSGRR